MNLLSLFAHLPTATLIGVVVSVVIPGLSSLLAKEHWPAELVGALTLLLATTDGFFSEWAKAGDGFAWKAAVGTAVLSYVVALASRFGILKGTGLDRKLRAVGSGTGSGDTGPGSIDDNDGQVVTVAGTGRPVVAEPMPE